MSKKQYLCKSDKEYLSELVVKYKDKIENKKVDAISNAEKKEAWDELRREFNAQGGTQRTTEELKRSWENAKAKRRKEIICEKQLRLKTGGGTYTSPPDTESTIPELDSLLGTNLDIELTNYKDSDGVQLKAINSSVILLEESQEREEDDEMTGDSVVQVEDSVVDVQCTSRREKTSRMNRTKKPSSSVYQSRADCIEAEKHERVRRVTQNIQHDQEYHKEKLKTQEEEQSYWRAKKENELLIKEILTKKIGELTNNNASLSKVDEYLSFITNQ
uniref:Regulatory protein zeste n=1 Tax=Cacopsylla melanoneura TaxID=428564 RepID=A0A8D9E948_9HEMI